jgi:hypothetical protein
MTSEVFGGDGFLLYLFGSFGSVFRAALFTVLNTNRIEGATDDMVPYSGQVFYPSSSNEDNGVFLEVMADTWDIGGHLNAVGQANTGDFPKGRVRFLRGRRINADADPPFLGRAGQGWRRCFVL